MGFNFCGLCSQFQLGPYLEPCLCVQTQPVCFGAGRGGLAVLLHSHSLLSDYQVSNLLSCRRLVKLTNAEQGTLPRMTDSKPVTVPQALRDG